MPAYSAVTSPTALYPGDSKVVFNNENPATGTCSTQVALGPATSDGANSVGASVELAFAGAPGAFEVDVQESDTDVDAAYVTMAAAAITTVNAQNRARIDLVNFRAVFLRLIQKTQNANAVNMTATIRR